MVTRNGRQIVKVLEVIPHRPSPNEFSYRVLGQIGGNPGRYTVTEAGLEAKPTIEDVLAGCVAGYAKFKLGDRVVVHDNPLMDGYDFGIIVDIDFNDFDAVVAVVRLDKRRYAYVWRMSQLSPYIAKRYFEQES